ncbi:hypothetical protein CP965_02920 [Halarcobacter mediterraneus]|uniref:Mannosyl-glycoprotein endo-beta-N-acetylglucosamidase-like domain-containing protein n=1 Tax=Halarcobacter mediterraneus TaxID=2023153 RepID=A0A4Q1B5K1_9BACT|nr:glucosaminidase domain-containing protein [Halarcobacter mediterraneus]RXK14417.1 hypothetical protein CP965_02920 [Halarcobacter mediterraneus]
MKQILLVLILTNCLFSYDKNFSYRKYTHVKKFYSSLVKETVDIALKYNMPPAAILAIASVESGYGRGYVASISGNILSLGANKNDIALPSLYLPNTKNPYKVIYNTKEIKSYKKEELFWKQRPKSLKKDYRPKGIAGTTTNLDYFDYNKQAKIKANLQNIKEFCTLWISYNNRFKAFSCARAFLDEQVKKHGKEILFTKKLNKEFINHVGGKKNSFNYRKTWPVKVNKVLEKTGLTELTKDISNNKSFDESW